MRAINHAMSGAIIGLTLGNPLVAAGAAFASHFVLDAVPHHDDNDRYPIGSPLFTRILIADALCCIGLVMVLFALLPAGTAAVASVCAFLATATDMMWIGRFVTARRTGADPGTKGLAQHLHAKAQWSETPRGKWVELVAAALFVLVLAKLL